MVTTLRWHSPGKAKSFRVVCDEPVAMSAEQADDTLRLAEAEVSVLRPALP